MHIELNYIEIEFNLSKVDFPQAFVIQKTTKMILQTLKYQDVSYLTEFGKPVFFHIKKENIKEKIHLSKKDVHLEYQNDYKPIIMSFVPSYNDNINLIVRRLETFPDLFDIEKRETDNFEIIKNYLEFKVDSICKKEENTIPKGPVKAMMHKKRTICTLSKYSYTPVFNIDKAVKPFNIQRSKVKQRESIIIQFNMIYLEEYEELYLLIKESFTVEEITEENEYLLYFCGRVLDLDRVKDLDTLTIFEGISTFTGYPKGFK